MDSHEKRSALIESINNRLDKMTSEQLKMILKELESYQEISEDFQAAPPSCCSSFG